MADNTPATTAITYILRNRPTSDDLYPYKSTVRLYADDRQDEVLDELTGTFATLGDALVHTANVVLAKGLHDTTVHINTLSLSPYTEVK